MVSAKNKSIFFLGSTGFIVIASVVALISMAGMEALAQKPVIVILLLSNLYLFYCVHQLKKQITNIDRDRQA